MNELRRWYEQLPRPVRYLFSRENLYAVLLTLLIIALLLVTTDSAPQWIYQGF